MSLEDKNKLNRIEELKSKLFSKTYHPELGHHDGFSYRQKKDIPDSWDNSHDEEPSSGDKFFMKTSMFKKFFIFSVGFFVLALGYAAYMFFAGGNTVSSNNIDIAVLGNAFTAGGEELPLQISITNRNKSALELVDLIVEYPKSSAGNTLDDTERFRESLGMIPSGAVRNENIKVTLFGEQGSSRQIKISIEYRVTGSNAIFTKEKLYDVSISSSPIDLSLEAPTEISPNQVVTLNIKETLNAAKPASNMLLRVDYPVGFQFVSSNEPPSFGNNIWKLGDLAPGVEHDISITGKMVDVFDGEEKTFRIWSGSQSLSDKSSIDVVFNSLGHTIFIKKPFIEARLLVNGIYQNEYATDNKTPIQGEIRWVNNLDTKITNLEIRAKITGNAVNLKTIDVQEGYYNSSQDSIIWDKNSQSEFKEVNPGASGTVTFSLEPLASALGAVLSEPSINIEVSISGKQPLEGDALKELTNSESKVVKIITEVGFASNLLYYQGPFTNTGPIPPASEKETTYTVSWTVTNTSNNISKAQVRSSLPPWVRFVGTISPITEDLKYNASTKEIIWNIDKIPKGTGLSSEGKQVYFQVALLPSLSQVGTTPVVVNDAVFTGFDDFAKVNVRVNKTSLNTRLANDPQFPASGERVVE